MPRDATAENLGRSTVRDLLASRELREPFVTAYRTEPAGVEARLMDMRSAGAAAGDVAKLRKAIQAEAKPKRASQLCVVDDLDPLQLHDVGNGKRLVRHHGQDLRFVAKWRRWICWDGRLWSLDETGEVERRAKAMAAAIYDEAATLAREGKTEAAESVAGHAKRSHSSRSILAAIACAASEPGITIRHDGLDANPWLLTVLNGTLDLKTGTLGPHRREDFNTKLAPVDFDPDATCPAFDKFLDELMLGRQGLVAFLRRYFGYCLTADVSEQVLVVLHGGGSNGKSTLLDILRAVFGDYGMQASTDLLMAPSAGVERHSTELTDLFGMRLCVAIENEEGRQFAEARVKQLTGGDRVRARRMREDHWEFPPTWKLALATNHKPSIRGTDDAIWRRIRLVPFDVRAVDPTEETPQPPFTIARDAGLLDRLRQEKAGILAWLVRGCLEWQRNGLGTPEEVRAATRGYRDSEDVLHAFLEERCIVGKQYSVAASAVFDEYQSWAKASGEGSLTKRTLGVRLAEKGFTQTKTGRNSVRTWTGLGLLTADATDATDPISHMNAKSTSHEALIRETRSVASVTSATLSVSCIVCGALGCDVHDQSLSF